MSWGNTEGLYPGFTAPNRACLMRAREKIRLGGQSSQRGFNAALVQLLQFCCQSGQLAAGTLEPGIAHGC